MKNKWIEKIMNANFKQLLKRWVIAALCVVLLGGGLSLVLLRPQISEAITAGREIHQQIEERHDTNDYEADGKHHGDWHDRIDFPERKISEPSTAAKVSVGITGALCVLFAVAFWLLIAAWLYQSAVLAGMNGLLWGVLGLCGNLFTMVLFWIIRAFTRQKCSSCGRWMDKGLSFCRNCGTKMQAVCPSCGAENPCGSHFCSSCGQKMDSDQS